MKAYILAVAGTVLLSAALNVLLPGGKAGKFIKGMIRLFMLAVVVAPLLNLFTKREFAFPQEELAEDSGYLAECARMLSEKSEEEIEAFLEEKFHLTAEAEVTRGAEGGFPYEKIKVNLSAAGISGQDEHIDMAEQIAAALYEKYGCEAEVIWSQA